MTTTPIKMSEDEFDEQFPLFKNHLNPNAGWVYGDGPGCLFETYGEELEFVRRQDPGTVWTFVDGDDGDQYLLSGFHFVNRIGYLISTVALPEGVDVEVRIPDGEADEHELVLPESLEATAPIAEESAGLPMPGSQQPRTKDSVRPTSPSPLLIPRAVPLVPGKMYLRLYHGRTDPDQVMDDWGFDGPTFGPLSSYVHTYCSTFRIYGEVTTRELWLETHGDMIQWDGCFYGDLEVFIAGTNHKA